MYNHYEQCNDFEYVLQSAANIMIQAMRECPMVSLDDLSQIKDNIVFQLVNTEQNREMLEDMPHREFLDLSIIYRWIVGMDENGTQSALIRNPLAERIGLNEEQLFKLSTENTRRIFPPCISSMTDVIREMCVRDGMPKELLDMMPEQLSSEQEFWIISNDCHIYGAASMLYENKLHELAEKVDNDLYIMPSSLHEVIAVSASLGEPYELAKVVEEVNMTEVSLEERLSNQVYHYDKELRKISLATDTKNKKLDGRIA